MVPVLVPWFGFYLLDTRVFLWIIWINLISVLVRFHFGTISIPKALVLLPYIDWNLPYRTKVFIGINVREIRDCQNRENFKPTKNNLQQVLDVWNPKLCALKWCWMTAQTGIRSQDTSITDPRLYQLSYTGTGALGQNHLGWSRIIEPVNIERRQHHCKFLCLVI